MLHILHTLFALHTNQTSNFSQHSIQTTRSDITRANEREKERKMEGEVPLFVYLPMIHSTLRKLLMLCCYVFFKHVRPYSSHPSSPSIIHQISLVLFYAVCDIYPRVFIILLQSTDIHCGTFSPLWLLDIRFCHYQHSLCYMTNAKHVNPLPTIPCATCRS
jgi:hypothetical protein